MTIKGRLSVVVLILLGLSLAANFMVAGFIAARVAVPGRALVLEQIVNLGVRAFPAEIRRAIIADALDEGAALAGALADFRQARQRAFAAMRADPLDDAALEAAFAEVRVKTAALQTVGQAIVVRAVAAATPEARAAIGSP